MRKFKENMRETLGEIEQGFLGQLGGHGTKMVKKVLMIYRFHEIHSSNCFNTLFTRLNSILFPLLLIITNTKRFPVLVFYLCLPSV